MRSYTAGHESSPEEEGGAAGAGTGGKPAGQPVSDLSWDHPDYEEGTP